MSLFAGVGLIRGDQAAGEDLRGDSPVLGSGVVRHEIEDALRIGVTVAGDEQDDGVVGSGGAELVTRIDFVAESGRNGAAGEEVEDGLEVGLGGGFRLDVVAVGFAIGVERDFDDLLVVGLEFGTEQGTCIFGGGDGEIEIEVAGLVGIDGHGEEESGAERGVGRKVEGRKGKGEW